MKRRRMGLVARFVGAAAALGFTAASGAEDSLVFALPKGSEARFGFSEVRTFTNISSVIRTGRNTTTYQTDMQWRVRVTERTEEGGEVELTYERVRFIGDSPVLKAPPVFDTAGDDAAENPFAPVLLALIGKPIVIKVSPIGEIRDIAPAVVMIPDVAFAGVGREMMTREWIEPRVRDLFTMGAPAGAPIGATWATTLRMPALIGVDQPIIMQGTLALEDTKGPLRAAQATLSASLGEVTGEADTKSVLREFKGGYSLVWDSGSGLLEASDLRGTWNIDTNPAPELNARVETIFTRTIRRLTDAP